MVGSRSMRWLLTLLFALVPRKIRQELFDLRYR